MIGSHQPRFVNTNDRFGNRWQQNGPNSFIATFTGNNPSNPQNNNRLDSHSYDAAGNLLNDGVHSYTYDAENRITTVDAGATATYLYDALGQRVEKTTPTSIANECGTTGTVFYVHDLSGHTAVYTPNGVNTCIDEIFAAGRHLATYSGPTTFSHSDWLGTERVRTTYYGTVCESIASLPFGDGQTTTGYCYHHSTLHFTGKERDPESGLDNFGARYDSSNLGRFMSPDPSNYGAIDESPQTWNAYSYVANNPLNAVDSRGLDCVYVSDDQKSATVRTGDCKSDTDNGIFVDGTVKSLSLSVSNQGDVLNIGFQPEGGDLTFHPENLGHDTSGLTAGVYNYVPKSDSKANLQKPSAAGAVALPLVVCQIAEPCGAGVDTVVIGAALITAAVYATKLTYTHFSSEQSLIRNIAREFGISATALGNAVHAWKRAHGMGPADNMTAEQLRELASEVKQGLWLGTE